MAQAAALYNAESRYDKNRLEHRHSRHVGLQKPSPQQRLQPLRKHLQPPRQMLSMGIKQRHRHRLGPMGRHDLDEFAALQMRPDVVSRYLDQTETGKTTGDIGLGIVDGDAAAHGKRMQRLAFDPFPVFHPPAGGRRVIDRPVAGEIVGRFRHSMTRQIGGACDIDQRQLAYRPRDQAGIAERSDAQHAIDIVFHQIDGAVGNAEAYVDLRIKVEKFRQRRCDDQPPDPARHVDPQPARRLRRRLPEEIFRIFDIGDQPLAALVKGRTILGWRDLARRAVQQPRTDTPFQFLHRRRNRRARYAERIGSPRETRAVNDACEDAEQVDTV